MIAREKCKVCSHEIMTPNYCDYCATDIGMTKKEIKEQLIKSVEGLVEIFSRLKEVGCIEEDDEGFFEFYEALESGLRLIKNHH